jgi:uncharacterized protein (TIGR02996 family)
MSDESALLAAIIAHPDEDTPRLMYADWLEENSQSERAEFIRLQIERERAPSGDPRRFNPTDRESQLLNRHRRVWERPLRELLPSARLDFTRGFVEEVQADATAYTRVADECSRSAPLRDILLRSCTDLCEANFAARPGRAWVRAVASASHRRTMSLLAPSPMALEPYLRTGHWIVLAWLAGSESDRRLVQRLYRVLGSDLPLKAPDGSTVRFAIRPFQGYAEFDSWCPELPEDTHPLWIRYVDGRRASVRVGPTPPIPLRDVWSWD